MNDAFETFKERAAQHTNPRPARVRQEDYQRVTVLQDTSNGAAWVAARETVEVQQ